MKNLLVHLNPLKCFNKEHQILAKIQIDNSLRLGWKTEDIILVTNFDYEYNGVRAVMIPDKYFCDFRPYSTKTVVVTYLLEYWMLPPDEVYWAHDFDAYQLEKFDFTLEKPMAFSDYGYSPKPSLGSYFFDFRARDFFSLLRDTIYEKRTEDERALVWLTKNKAMKIIDSFQKINITYNFGMRHVEKNWEIADKPLKVIHFHPWGKDLPTLDIFMYGKNKLGFPLMSKQLIKLFHKHGIR